MATAMMISGASWAGRFDVVADPDPAAPLVGRCAFTATSGGIPAGSARPPTSYRKAAKPALSSIGFNEELAYNPSIPGEVWILSIVPNGVFKSTDAALSGWKDVTPAYSCSTGIAFTGAGSVHLTHWTSTTDGDGWDPAGPLSGDGSIIFDPGDSQVGYVGDGTYGPQKTTDGGTTWEVKDQGPDAKSH